MYTQCPSCQTVFRVSASHLKVAHGKVRCGRCSTVFNALETLVEIDEPTSRAASKPEKLVASESASAPPNPATDAFNEIDIPGFDEEVPAQSTAEAPAENGFDAALDFGDDGGIFSQANPADAIESTPETADALDLTADLAEPIAPAATAPDTAPAPNDFGEVATNAIDAPGLEFGASQSKPATLDGAELDFDLGIDGSPPADIAENSTQEAQEFAELLGDKEPARDSLPFETTELPSDIPSVSADDYVLHELGEVSTSKWSWLATVFWTLLISILLVVLVLQFAYFKREELAKYPQIRPYLEQMCEVASQYFACEIPQPRDVHAIELLERDVRTHPNRSNALLIVATLVNKAEFAQPFPMLQITFADINQKIVASRDFKPDEYLSKDVNKNEGMKPNVPVRMMVEIVDPGPEAVNFEFIFK